MIRTSAIFFLFLSLIGCQEVNYPEPPEQLISEEKMVQILVDAYITNASRSKGVNNRIIRTKGIKLDSLLYSKHGIDSLSFAESNAYYASYLDKYTAIISEVEIILAAKKKEIDSIAFAEQNRMFKYGDTTKPKVVKASERGELKDPVQDEEE